MYEYEKEDTVKIIAGEFKNFSGVITDVNQRMRTLQVEITIFGRKTSKELKFDQIEKV